MQNYLDLSGGSTGRHHFRVSRRLEMTKIHCPPVENASPAAISQADFCGVRSAWPTNKTVMAVNAQAQ